MKPGDSLVSKDLRKDMEVVEMRSLCGKVFALDGNRDSGRFRGRFLVRGMVHYREDMSIETGPLKEIDLTIDENGYCDKAPYKIRIYKDRIGYTYTSRTKGRVDVVLAEINGKPVDNSKITTSQKENMFFWDNVATGLRMKLELFSTSAEIFKLLENADTARNFKWLVREDVDSFCNYTKITEGVDSFDPVPQTMEMITACGGESIKTSGITGNQYKEYYYEETWTGRVSKVVDRSSRQKKWSEDVVYPCIIDASTQDPITAYNDDGWSGAGGSVWNQGHVFAGITGTAAFNGGMRFAMNVPKDSVINSAYLEMQIKNNVGTPSLKIYADDVDDAPAWSNSSRPASGFTKTTASKAWYPTAGTDVDSTVSITSIIEEIVVRSGWASGNNIRLGIFDQVGGSNTDYVQIKDYNTSFQFAVLNIDFTAPPDFIYLGDISVSAALDAPDFAYTGDVGVAVGVTPNGTWLAEGIYNGSIDSVAAFSGDYSATFAYTGDIPVAAPLTSDYDGKFNYTGDITISIPLGADIGFDLGVPYAVQPIVTIEGVVYNESLSRTVNVHRQDNAAATFKVSINTALKPSSFIDKEITISFFVTDSTGNMVTFSPIFIGRIREVDFTDGIDLLTLSGYDYSGVHNSFGELVSQDITTVLAGSVLVSAAGQIDTGQAPIWAANYQGTDDVVDGRDFFVSTLTGKIEIPISSNLILSPGGIGFSYMDPFASLKALIESIVGIKGWVIVEDGITMADYSSTTEQPVISISNESIIDAVRKLIELSGAKVEANLYPELRVYSETVNLTGADNHIIDETTKYIEDSLKYDIDIDDLITKQTVRSVAKTFADAEVSVPAEIANKSGLVTRDIVHVQFTFTQEDVDYMLSLMTGLSIKKIAEVVVPKANIFSVSHVAGGTTIPVLPANVVSIQNSDWVQTINDDSIVYSLWVQPLLEFIGIQAYISYPGADWTLQVNGTSINYGEGTIEETVEVTGTRPVIGIAGDLVGDVYENSHIETDTHAGNIVNAILTDRGNFYKARFDMPLHESVGMEIGDKLNIEKVSVARFKGIIKELDYSLDTETAQATASVVANGVGIGI